MSALKSRAIALVGALLCAAQAGCAAAPPKEIIGARVAMDRARRSPTAARAKLEMYDAQAALTAAEREISAGSPMAGTHAYVAMRMAERARIAGLFAADQEASDRASTSASELRQNLARRDEALRDRARRALAERDRRAEASRAMVRALDQARGARGQLLLEPSGIRLRLPTEVLFQSWVPLLQRGAEAQLQAIAAAIQAGPPCFVWIQVLDDVEGLTTDGGGLARRRVARIREALIAYGVPADYFYARPESPPAAVRGRAPLGAQVDVFLMDQPVHVPPVVIPGHSEGG